MWIKDDEVFENHSAIRAHLQQADPPVSLPDVISDEMITELGFNLVVTEHPAFNPKVQKLAYGDIVFQDGQWVRQCTVEPLSPGERKALVPEKVTARQGVAALIMAGLYDDLLALFAAIPDPIDRKLAEVDFERSQTFERNSNRVRSWSAALGMSEEHTDDLFIFASTIPA
jgi:hypothetical protein